MRAMILAAGRGERMRPLTDATPKPLLQVGGKPLIVWHIERLARAGITQLVINHAWLGSQIEARLLDGSQYGVKITYSPEPTPLETAGGIAQALNLLGPDPFLVINGDIWCDWDPGQAQAIAQALNQQKKLAWLLLTDNPIHNPKGDFTIDAFNNATDARTGTSPNTLTFTGIGVYQPGLFAGLEKSQPAPLAPLLRLAMLKNQVGAEHYNGQWVDVGTPERLELLDRLLGDKNQTTV